MLLILSNSTLEGDAHSVRTPHRQSFGPIGNLQPTYELDAQPLFAPYFERAGISPSDISGQAFELVVTAWLGDLVRSDEQREALTEGQPVLAESGFLTVVRDGRIEYEEAA